VKGILGGVLTLIVLQALTANDKTTAQGGKLLVWLASGVNHALSPKVAAIPNRKPPKAQPAPKSSSPSTGGVDLPRNPSVGTVSV
jgi:hypothetical protein